MNGTAMFFLQRKMFRTTEYSVVRINLRTGLVLPGIFIIHRCTLRFPSVSLTFQDNLGFGYIPNIMKNF